MADDNEWTITKRPAPTETSSSWDNFVSTAGDVAQALASPSAALAKVVARHPQTADDAVRAFSNAVTFGMADRVSGALPGGAGSTGAEVKLSEAARERSPYASIAGDVAGAAALPGIGGRQLAARYGGGLLARGAGYGAEGAVLGAAQGAGNTYTGNPMDYLTNAGVSAGMGGVLGFGLGSVFGPRGGARSTAYTPSTAELFREKTGNYRALEGSGALYEPSALAHVAGNVETGLRGERYHESRSPVTFQALDEMRGAPTAFPLGAGTPVSPGDIEFIRKGLNQINPVTEATDRSSARAVKRALDDFVLNPPQGAVIPGTEAAAAEATALANRARGNYGGFKRGQAFEDIFANAETAAGSANSGLNVENQLRQGLRSFVRQKEGMSPASKAGYNPDEIDALTAYSRGTHGANFQRWVSNALGGGGGIAVPFVGAVGGQYFRDNPTEGAVYGAAAPALGFAAKVMGNRRARREMDALGEMVRQRTPLYQERAATAPMALPGEGAAAQRRVRNALTEELVRRQEQE